MRLKNNSEIIHYLTLQKTKHLTFHDVRTISISKVIEIKNIQLSCVLMLQISS